MSDTTPLTARQRQVFDAIVEHVREHGYPPSVRDMCAAVGVSSPNALACHLAALERLGYIERPAGGQSRAIKIIVRDACCPTCGQRVVAHKRSVSGAVAEARHSYHRPANGPATRTGVVDAPVDVGTVRERVGR